MGEWRGPLSSDQIFRYGVGHDAVVGVQVGNHLNDQLKAEAFGAVGAVLWDSYVPSSPLNE